ncbi:MAG TPA: arginase family protein [Alphaproteobacteria bacterium]|nr:arginase family protein [Alphaproteobacteria bacterium]
MRRLGPGETARRALHAIPSSAPILLHFDIDVVNKQEMPAAYFPHADGLSLAETQELLGTILEDSRLRIIEVAEYASLRDLDRSAVAKIIDILAAGLQGPRLRSSV